jgi:hypothetical protein
MADPIVTPGRFPSSLGPSLPRSTQKLEELYETVFALNLDTQVPISALVIRVSAKSLAWIDVKPGGTMGMIAKSIEPSKDGSWVATISNATGFYSLKTYMMENEIPSVALFCAEGKRCDTF